MTKGSRRVDAKSKGKLWEKQSWRDVEVNKKLLFPVDSDTCRLGNADDVSCSLSNHSFFVEISIIRFLQNCFVIKIPNNA